MPSTSTDKCNNPAPAPAPQQVVAAYNGWRAVAEKDGRQAAREFSERSFLADQALEVRVCVGGWVSGVADACGVRQRSATYPPALPSAHVLLSASACLRRHDPPAALPRPLAGPPRPLTPHAPSPPSTPHPPSTLAQAIDAGRQQYAELLADLGFVPASYASAAAATGRGRRGGGAAGVSREAANPYGKGGERPLHDVDEHSANARTVKAALCCGSYPQVARLRDGGCWGGGGRRWPAGAGSSSSASRTHMTLTDSLHAHHATPAAAARGAPSRQVHQGARRRGGDRRRPI